MTKESRRAGAAEYVTKESRRAGTAEYVKPVRLAPSWRSRVCEAYAARNSKFKIQNSKFIIKHYFISLWLNTINDEKHIIDGLAVAGSSSLPIA